jgi:hypothetical protein
MTINHKSPESMLLLSYHVQQQTVYDKVRTCGCNVKSGYENDRLIKI